MNVDFTQAIQIFFANYANFKGRSTRAEYWWIGLFMIIVYVIMLAVCALLQLGDITTNIISSLWNLFILVPSLALTVRRLHDVGKGGGWIFIFLVPIIGWIWFLILMLTASQPDNRFGRDPYGSEE